MNYRNTTYWYVDGYLYAEWTSQDRDDSDNDGTPRFTASTPAESVDDYYAMKRIKSQLVRKYDKWIEETGR